MFLVFGLTIINFVTVILQVRSTQQPYQCGIVDITP